MEKATNQVRTMVCLALVTSILLTFIGTARSDGEVILVVGESRLVKIEGLWRISEKNPVVKKGNQVIQPGIHLFRFDGRYVTVRLFTEKKWMWRTPDDVYKLKARLEGNDLYYLPPFANWQFLATFEKGNFIIQEKSLGHKWAFKRIRDENLGQRDQAFLATRDLHDYSIAPTRTQRRRPMPDPYAKLKEHFSGVKRVTVNAGRGAQGMKVGKKMFAMFYNGDLVLTLPPARVEELIATGRGLPFDPGTGKAMKNRVLIPVSKKRSWVKLCEEAVAAF